MHNIRSLLGNYLALKISKTRWKSITCLAMAIAVVGGFGVYRLFRVGSKATDASTDTTVLGDEQFGASDRFTFPHTKWDIAGIEAQTAEKTTISQVVRVTGTLALNEDRLAQISPQVEGVVHKVPIQFGQKVRAGEPILIIDSQQIGAAKLELIRNRLDRKLAEVDHRWKESVAGGAFSLIKSLQDNIPLDQIEAKFADRDLGDYRSQLITAYAQLFKSRADYQRLRGLSDQGATAGKDSLAAKAAFEADRATMQALLEQIKFTANQNEIAAKQALEKARTAESISETNLRILGVSETASIGDKPPESDEQFAHYTLTAPLAGTIIAKDVTFREHVDPTSQLLTIADLSTLWLRANIFEKQVSLVESLVDKTVNFHTASYPDRTFRGKVFFTGSVIDPQTRTLPMTALVENSDGLLKAGMFVDIELPGEAIHDVLAVGTDSLLDSPSGPTLFVQVADETFEMRQVLTGASGGGLTEIKAGLKSGESVVVKGAFFLKSEMLADQFADED